MARFLIYNQEVKCFLKHSYTPPGGDVTSVEVEKMLKSEQHTCIEYGLLRSASHGQYGDHGSFQLPTRW
jgi:hypothetical protein